MADALLRGVLLALEAELREYFALQKAQTHKFSKSNPESF